MGMADHDDTTVEELAIDSDNPGSGTGTNTEAEDRGDDFTPTDGDDDNEAASGKGKDDAGADGDDEGDDEAVSGRRRGGIPPERLNEVNAKRREAEERAARAEAEAAALKAQLQAQQQAPAAATPDPAAAPDPQPAAATVDEIQARIETLEAEADNALLEGDLERKRELMREVKKLERELTLADITAREQARTFAAEATALASTAAKLVKEFPVLDEKTGDPDAIDLVIKRRERYVQQHGMTRVEALEKAAREVGAIFGGGKAAPAADDPAPAGDPRPSRAAERAARMSTDQPPDPASGLGERATQGRINVANMSEKEFNALSPEDKKRLRGD